MESINTNTVESAVDTAIVERVPFGSEHGYEGEDACPDCGVAVGELHKDRCDAEECPVCHFQLISCPCQEEDADDEPDEEASEIRVSLPTSDLGRRLKALVNVLHIISQTGDSGHNFIIASVKKELEAILSEDMHVLEPYIPF